MFLAGVAGVIYAFTMDVAAPYSSTINLELLQRRELVVIVGVGLAIAGSVFTVGGAEGNRRQEETEAAARRAERETTCPHCAMAIAKAAKACPHCTRDIPTATQAIELGVAPASPYAWNKSA